MAIYLSGIQPSGLPHLGNYFGAIKHHIDLQSQAPEPAPERPSEGPAEHFYFIAFEYFIRYRNIQNDVLPAHILSDHEALFLFIF